MKVLQPFHDPRVIASSGQITTKWPSRASFNSFWEYVTALFWTVAKFNEYSTSHGLIKAATNHLGAHVVVAGCGYLVYTDHLKKLPEGYIAEDMLQTWFWQLDGWMVWCVLGVFGRSREPVTGKNAGQQRYRWLCGFWQNYSAYGWTILKHHPKLALLVNFMVLNVIGYPVLLIDNLFNSGGITNFLLAFVAQGWESLVIIIAMSMIYPMRLGKTFREKIMYALIGFLGIIPAIVLGLQAQAINLQAFWTQIVMKNWLTEWVLGHTTARTKKSA